MRKRFIGILLLFIIVTHDGYSTGFSIMQVVNFLTKVSDKMSGFEKEIEKYQSEFREYYNKYWKNFNRKFFPHELELLKMEDPSEIYRKSYIDPETADDVWGKIFRDPKNIWKSFPYLTFVKHYKDNELYKKDKIFRKRMDENLKELKLYLMEVEKAVRLIADTRKMQKKRGEKVARYKSQNDLLGMPKAYWEAKKVKLLTFGAMLEYELQHQIVELILLMNLRTELRVKGELLVRNMKGREREYQLEEEIRAKKGGK